jgi:hypothetical protein
VVGHRTNGIDCKLPQTLNDHVDACFAFRDLLCISDRKTKRDEGLTFLNSLHNIGNPVCGREGVVIDKQRL